MSVLQNVTVVIPSLDPDDRLPAVIRGVQEQGFTDILLVDDGSAEENQHYFTEAETELHCTVLHHPKNLGKGHALKTAFHWLLEHRPEAKGCVTIDGDGQHHPEDIRACAEKMCEAEDDALWLGVRDFSAENVPPKSRSGNRITSAVFRLFCGIAVTDTQTGLRVFPRGIWQAMTEISGERFEYETNMLLRCGQDGIPIREHSIRTIYFDENAATHFKPVRDSVRIYGNILRFHSGSLVCRLLELIFFCLLNGILSTRGFSQHLFIAAALSALIGLCCGFLFNRRELFRSEVPRATAAARHCILCVFRLLLSFLLIRLLTLPFGDSIVLQDICKLLTDIPLAMLFLRIRRAWFRK